MIFGKYINKYYLKNAPILILGLAALILVDYFQLFIPELYRMVINGMNGAPVLVNGQAAVFDMEFLLDQVCRPMIITIIVMVPACSRTARSCPRSIIRSTKSET